MTTLEKNKYARMSLISSVLTTILVSAHYFADLGFSALALGGLAVILLFVSLQRFSHSGSSTALWIYGLLNVFIVGFAGVDGLWNHIVKTFGYNLLLVMHGGDPKVIEKVFSLLPPAVGTIFHESTGVLAFLAGICATYFGYKFLRFKTENALALRLS